jgi:hypothetical protein
MQSHASLTNYPQLDDEILRYYASIIEKKQVPVQVKHIDPLKGKGLFALKSFEKDEVLFTGISYF